MSDNRPIGVIDSGVGGLTVAKKLREILPQENIIYFGDNKNVPYGNKPEEEIYRLTKNMIDILIKKDVKLIAVACNTISTIVEKYFSDYNLPIVDIITPVVDHILDEKIDEVGILATTFTIETGLYQKFLKTGNPDINLVAEGSPKLAATVDSGEYTEDEIGELVDLHIGNILKERKVDNIVLGCTHFPIVLEEFKKRNPEINFIDPARAQVLHIDEIMKRKDIKANEIKATFNIYTTGNKRTYEKILGNLNMEGPDSIIELE